MYNLSLTNSAENDLDEILESLELVRPMGSFNFSLQIENIFERIERNPYIFEKRILHFRRAFIDKHPYIFYYSVLESLNEIEVIAIVHNKRGIQYIKRKLGI